MKTKKQEELINSYLSAVGDEFKPLYGEIIGFLSELGYYPQKEKSNISFKHDLHNKQIAKLGIKKNKEQSSFFALRFSACSGYPEKFTKIVSDAVIKYPSRVPGCLEGKCVYCMGKPDTHVYSYTFPDGTRKSHCGAYALEIPDITADDIGELKKLIEEEHKYLLGYEAGRN